jgi:hypothetical protein
MPSTSTWSPGEGRLVSVPVSVHQPVPDSTWDDWLDLAPDLSCKDSTQDYCLDVEHQARDVVLGSPTFSLARRQAGDPAPRRFTG